MKRRIVTGWSILIGLVLCCWLWLVGAAIAQAIPTTMIESEGQYAAVPDWSQITFGILPAILSDGGFDAPADVNQMLGYDFSRTWQAGDRADTYLKLGDFQNSLYLQVFNLYTISQISGFDPSQVALSSLELASWQTIDDLVTAIPGLGNYQVKDVAPIAALLKDKVPLTPGWNPDADNISTIVDVLNTNPDLGKLSLGELDNLGEFSLTDIPDLSNVPLQNFSDWGNSAIAGVPGLSDVPLDQMPNPLDVFGLIATIDVVYGTAESDRTNTISGSQQAGFKVACQTNCAYAELTGDSSVHGKQWISGQYQEVEGGFGVLKVANGGKEPTGRHPFGNAFKVAVWDTDESTGSVSTALFFRVCYRGIPDLGCTPYFLGPVPFLSYHEKDPMFIGLMDLQGGASSPVSIPEGVMEAARKWGIPESALSGGGVSSSGSLCGVGEGGVDFEALAAAFSSIEGNYGSVGSFTCADGGANCGRGLGRYQYMSYRSDVRQVISQKDGGAGFLARLDSGESVSEAELERFLSKTDQDNLFKADQTQNINQAIAEGFTGSRIIERVGQIHFGGPGAPIDGGASDAHGRLSLKTYGEELRGQYESVAQDKGSGNCGKANGKLTNPVPGTPALSEMGWRVHPIYGDERFHSGIDLAAAEGTPVRAADGGTVTFSRVDGSMTSGYGQMVIIDHGNGRETRYAHLSTMDVKEGQQIAQGDVLGKVGSTGGVTGAHLHFEVRENDEPVDPRQYINFQGG
jgi:murein DD-endopeptidase MepM/ murein hydrolase activator NlpD